MAAPVVQGFTWSEATTDSFVMTAPSGITAGELLVLLVGNTGDTDVLMWSQANAPAGWTYYNEIGDSGIDVYAGIFYKVADGTESDVTVISNGEWLQGGWYIRLSGADVYATFINGYRSGRVQTTTAHPSFSGVTTTADDCIVLANCCYDGGHAGAISIDSGATLIDSKVYAPGVANEGLSRAFSTQEMLTAGVSPTINYRVNIANGWAHQFLAIVAGNTPPPPVPIITGQPQDASVPEFNQASFRVIAQNPVGETSTITYQWYEATIGELFGETGTTLSFTSEFGYDGNGYYVEVSNDAGTVTSATATLTVTDAESGIKSKRSALVWNFDDDNFTWMDASAVVGAELSPAVCIEYGFEPGWQARWSDLEEKNVTWDDLQNGVDPWGTIAGSTSTTWQQFYEAGNEQNLYYLTPTGVYLADQDIDKSGVKSYYATRVNIDYDDVVPQLRSNNYKYANQIFFHLQSRAGTVAPNSFTFQVGGGNNLMDAPVWQDPVTVDLLNTVQGGKHKVDFRATWRYHAMHWDFTLTDALAMTGADINLEESHGR